MNKRHYDLAFGFGAVCGCSLTLRRAGLQYLSFPGDWTAPVWFDETHPRIEHDLRKRADLFCNGLDELFLPGDFRFLRSHPWNGKDIYCNIRHQYTFNHDFPAGGDFASEMPKVKTKYFRRYERLIGLIRSSKRVLVVRMDMPHPERPKATLDDCRYARMKLSKKFPGVIFDFVLLSYDQGRTYENRVEEITDDGIFHYAFDYLETKPGKDPWQPDLALTSRHFAERFSVRDYRSPQEIAAHEDIMRRKKWSKYGAKGPLGYFVKKLLSKFRHSASTCNNA